MISPSFSSEDDSKQALVIGKLKNNVEIEGITLRSFVNLSDEEKEMVRQWRNSGTVRKWMFNSAKISIEEHCDFMKSLKEKDNKFYLLVQNKKGGYLGTVDIYDVDLKNKRCMWGYAVSPEIIGRGVGVLLEYLALYLAFYIAQMHCLRCETLINNKNAIELHKFFNFEIEGTYKDYIYKDNQYHDVVVMSILKKDWVESEKKIKNLVSKFFV